MNVQQLIDKLMKIKDKDMICQFLDDTFGLISIGKVSIVNSDTEFDYGNLEYENQVVMEQ